MRPTELAIVVNPSAGKDGDDSVRAELAELLPDATLLDVDDGDKALRLFKSNRSFGLVVFVGLVLDGLL